ncbi:hypothetical protein UFOVP751_47 [uncultured Caudovirales phage]|uniref:Uncharacterized protein n=1 Tax=uncultured Caudovirales phage TaxID=2100421 RepID=A0A6J7XRB2_9CAUD|nr:hypothetical protein UFOVP751_47 [uncultured Caudovirales phage]
MKPLELQKEQCPLNNIYRHQFIAECPNNGKQIIYSLTIKADKKVMVEHIITACSLVRRGYHEDIADDLHKALGGYQVITAHHHGVDIETHRG